MWIFGLFLFMNCINNFSICVKIYCQIHILSLIFFFLLISDVRYRTSPQRRGLTYHPVFEAKNIFLPVLYIELSSTGRCGTTILHQDTISQLIIETVNDILVDCRLGLKKRLSTCVIFYRRVVMSVFVRRKV